MASDIIHPGPNRKIMEGVSRRGARKRASVLALAIAAVMVAAFSGSARAACTITGTVNTTLNMAGLSNCTIKSTGHIDVSGRGIVGPANRTITVERGGRITTTGNNADGIYLSGDNNTITNNGTIFATETDSAGIELGGTGNSVTNTGSIISGDDWGIDATGGIDTVTNSGLIRGLLDPKSSATTGAISFAGTDNRLILNPGSVLIGLVKLGGGTGVEIYTDLPVILHVDDLSKGGFSSTKHTIYTDTANQRVIALDPKLMEKNNSGGTLVSLVGNGVSSVLFGGDAATTVVTAAAGDGPARRGALDAQRVSVLAGGFVNSGKSKATKLWSTALGGLMALRFHPSPAFLVGLHGGAGHTKTKGSKGKASWFGGVHARYETNGVWLAGLLTAGRAGAGGSITFLNNFSSTGYSTHALNGRAKFITGEARLGFTLAVPDAPVTLSPELMARVTRLNSRVRLDGLAVVPAGGGKSTMFDGRAQITTGFDLSTMSDQQVRLLLTSGIALHDEKGGANDRVTGFGGVKFQVRMAEGVNFFASAESHVGKGGLVGVGGSAGVNVPF